MNYAIIFGGNSYEHEISIVSAVVLKKILKEVIFIFCDSERNFYLIPSEKMNSKTFCKALYKKEKQIFLKNAGFYQKNLFNEKKIEFDCAINLIHGKDGEDGKIAALFDFYKINYIGARLEASVLSYNKELTKLYAQKVGVKTLPYFMIKKYDNQKQDIEFPVILKPARLGSSIGISVAKNEKEFEYAKDVAFEFDDEILVESFKNNIKEYNLAGCMIDDEFIFSIIEEPNKQEYLDFKQKYLSFSSHTTIKEAPLEERLKEKLKENFKKIYNPLFKGALIRCDFFIINDEVYLNEINPNPGSLANYLFDNFTEVLQKLAQNCKNEKSLQIEYKFLNSINGQKGKL
ncbi:D-alanine--D-alanine ligase [Campylobacter novaezeelandiae]|uniref:D-alanine--D-alanine ligase n=1 Tax=Campylobacter novaezeelandiae TaxID=2267891 RepID=UPI001C1E8AC0|nr:D-alanine--D-alanine ligase [Campylobacter novaezeelandiae]QWU80018.1 D-alanine--D-alanine ligase [Campylobacter novaezeelandiae]